MSLLNKKDYYTQKTNVELMQDIEDLHLACELFDDDLNILARAIRHFTSAQQNLYYLEQLISFRRIWNVITYIDELLDVPMQEIQEFKEKLPKKPIPKKKTPIPDLILISQATVKQIVTYKLKKHSLTAPYRHRAMNIVKRYIYPRLMRKPLTAQSMRYIFGKIEITKQQRLFFGMQEQKGYAPGPKKIDRRRREFRTTDYRVWELKHRPTLSVG